jgi:hypothetical protein
MLALGAAAGPVRGGEAAASAELGWLAGHWRGVTGDTVTEEVWLPAAGGLMLGLHREVRPGAAPWFEFLRIVADPGGVVYEARPGGGPPTRFPLVESRPGRAVFANPDHDFPRRIIYRLEAPDRLVVRVDGGPTGPPEERVWTWRRVEPALGEPGSE